MIYTFGDGFAAGHIWPEWPQLLEPLLQTSVKNFGHIGAGNEYIFNCAVKSALNADPDDIFIIQWAPPERFDKLLEDPIWEKLQKTDSVYKDITAEEYNQVWWATSGSSLAEITKYKQFYIQSQQAVNRTVLYMITLSKMLDSLGIQHLYFLTYSFDYSLHDNYKNLRELPWIELNQGMEEWSKQYIELRGTEIQPKPIIHVKYIIEKLLPKLDITLDSIICDKIYFLINGINFVPYDIERAQIWIDLKDEINLLFK